MRKFLSASQCAVVFAHTKSTHTQLTFVVRLGLLVITDLGQLSCQHFSLYGKWSTLPWKPLPHASVAAHMHLALCGTQRPSMVGGLSGLVHSPLTSKAAPVRDLSIPGYSSLSKESYSKKPQKQFTIFHVTVDLSCVKITTLTPTPGLVTCVLRSTVCSSLTLTRSKHISYSMHHSIIQLLHLDSLLVEPRRVVLVGTVRQRGHRKPAGKAVREISVGISVSEVCGYRISRSIRITGSVYSGSTSNNNKKEGVEEEKRSKQEENKIRKMSSSANSPNHNKQQQEQVQHPDPFVNPPSFTSFACASPNPDRNSSPTEIDADKPGEELMAKDRNSESVDISTPLTPWEESEPLPCRDLTGTPLTSKNDNSVRGESEDDNTKVKDPIHEEHLCLSSSGNLAPSRHDTVTSPIDVDHDTSASEGLETFGRSGIILDNENEGDREVLQHLASGTSNITGDLDQLHPGQSSPEGTPDSPHAMETNVADGKVIAVEPTMLDKKAGQSNSPPTTSEQVSGKNKAAFEDTKKTDSEAPARPEDNDEHPNKGNNKRDQKATEDEDTDIEKRTRIEQERYDRCMKEHDEFYRLEDERLSKLPSPDTSESYDEGGDGRAGLDPDHSSLWGPEVIDTSVNLSKSKKRRRRHQKKREQLQNQDSLSKLLHGKQTREDEERISTYDLGNQRNIQGGQDLNTSGIRSGNLDQKRQKFLKACDKEVDFVATLNSTRYGPDFDQDSSDSRSILRGNSDEEKLMQENLEVQEDVEDGDVEASNDGIDDNADAGDEKAEQDKESSNNSTNGKRKRKRKNKTASNPKLTKQEQQQPPDTKGRETRSKTQGKAGPTADDSTRPKEKEQEAPKGEKEKNTDPETFVIATAQQSQLSVFKQPSCSRSELRRLVAKAVRKPKAKLSNNFALNSKIEYFKITTDSANVKKIPVIDDEAPLVEMAIPEFIWPEHDKTIEDDNLVNVKSRGVIPFIVLVRSCHLPDDPWDAPAIDKVRDFASYMSCQIAEHKLEFGTVLRWTNPWGNVAVMGLDSSDLGLLLRFRTFLTTLRYVHQFFNTFPKDAMIESLGISIILKSDLREFQEKYLAEALFARNDLSGVLDTLQSETFTASDRTRAGVSKNGWRNVRLEGDDVFLPSLSKFTALHWFPLGPAAVQIHGGERRAETEAEIEAKNKRRRFNMPVGQTLTESARASINKSFLTDQEKLAKNLIVPSSATAAQSGANRAPVGRKKR